ncbi:transketolase C-terminal domain-containing protein, partial [Staphylococcus epidermidis]|uniref:transketolase C-terminal domain-containing protein n=1 Tax=Staphylococcus epidermidis TaxID=1282 RepID=UPI0037DA5CBE
YSVEVIELGTVEGIDIDSVVGSVEKSGGGVVVEEAEGEGGVGGEVGGELGEGGIV